MVDPVKRFVEENLNIIEVNEFCTLQRWMGIGIDSKVDRITVEFNIGHNFDPKEYRFEIYSRDPYRMSLDIANAMVAFFSMVGNQIAQEFLYEEYDGYEEYDDSYRDLMCDCYNEDD